MKRGVGCTVDLAKVGMFMEKDLDDGRVLADSGEKGATRVRDMFLNDHHEQRGGYNISYVSIKQ